MKHCHILLILSFTLSFQLQAQDENPLAFLEKLMGKTWVIDAEWGDGSVFRQEITVSYGLQGNIIIFETKGFIDAERTQFGDRSFGVRKYDTESEKVLFWEFDTFGGVTTGEIKQKGKDIWFIYRYGGSTIADIWEYLDDETFAFRVVAYDNNQIGELYLKGAYRAK